MIVFVLVLIACHFVVYKTYGWVLQMGAIQPNQAMSVMAIGFLLGFMVAVIAMLPGRNKRSKEDQIDDLFSRTSQATLIRREPQAVPETYKNPAAVLASQSARTGSQPTGATGTSPGDSANLTDTNRPR
jgi:uncharacterized membrane protein